MVDNVTLTEDIESPVKVTLEIAMQTPDVVIHVTDSLTQDQQRSIEGALREVDGVIAPRFNKPHLLVVLYSAAKTNSSALLRTVTTAGYKAQLVGL